MERKISWYSGYHDEIELVYDKANINESVAATLMELENMALQEAEESNEELQEAGAMTIISMMIDDCPLEMIYDSLFGSRAVSIGL